MQLDHSIRAMIRNIKVASAIKRQPHRLDKLHTLRRSPFPATLVITPFSVA